MYTVNKGLVVAFLDCYKRRNANYFFDHYFFVRNFCVVSKSENFTPCFALLTGICVFKSRKNRKPEQNISNLTFIFFRNLIVLMCIVNKVNFGLRTYFFHFKMVKVLQG